MKKTLANININSYFIIFFLAIIYFSITSCQTTFLWKKPHHRAFELPMVFNQSDLVGQGLKITNDGYLTRSCLKNIETINRGGILSIRFYRVDNRPFVSVKDPEFSHFINKSFERAIIFNLDKEKILAIAMEIKIKNRSLGIKEENAKFRNDISDLVDSYDLRNFYAACGTHFIHSIQFDSSIFFFTAFYLPDSDADKISAEVDKQLSRIPEDIQQLRIFQKFHNLPKAYFSLQADTEKIFTPFEFTLKKVHGRDIDDILAKALGAVLSSKSGKMISYQLRLWRSLSRMKEIVLSPVSQTLKSNEESIFNSLEILEDSIFDYKTYLHQIGLEKKKIKIKEFKKTSTRECLSSLSSLEKILNWDFYKACKDESWKNNTADLRNINECREIIKSINAFYANKKCLLNEDFVAGLKNKEPSLNLVRPIELTHHQVKDPLQLVQVQTDYRFKDEDQTENIPGKASLGMGVDENGKFYPGNCIQAGTQKFSLINQRDFKITNDYYPHSYTGSPRIFRILLFWKKPPPGKIRYRGSFEITGFSKKLLPNFKLTEEAKKLSEENMDLFYEKCGTHYVNEIKHRRGFVYYFKIDGKDFFVNRKTKPKNDAKKDTDKKARKYNQGKKGIDKKVEKSRKTEMDIFTGKKKITDKEKITETDKANKRRVVTERKTVIEGEDNILLDKIIEKYDQTKGKKKARKKKPKEKKEEREANIQIIPFGIDAALNKLPDFKPLYLNKFFENKKKIISYFQDNSNAIPVGLNLEPWSEYFRLQKLLNPKKH